MKIEPLKYGGLLLLLLLSFRGLDLVFEFGDDFIDEKILKLLKVTF